MQSLLIIFDRLPYGLLGCYGNMDATTPGFDRLAATGVTFDLCFATDFGVGGTPVGLTEVIVRLASRGTAVQVVFEEGATAAEPLTSTIGKEACTLVPHSKQPLADRLDETLRSLPDHRRAARGALTIVSLAGIPSECTSDEMRRVNETLAEADAVIARVVDWHDQQSTHETNLLLVTGAAGMPRQNDATATERTRLSDCLMHVPLLGRLGARPEYGVRCNALVTTGDIAATLSEWFGHECLVADESRSLLRAAGEARAKSRECVILIGRDGEAGIRTHHWCLTTRIDTARLACTQRPAAVAAAALYSKPDDSWDVFDVASQAPQIVEELIEQLIAALDARRK